MSDYDDVENLAREFGRTAVLAVAPEESQFYDEVIDIETQPKRFQKDYELGFGAAIGDLAVPALLFAAGKIVIEALWAAVQPSIAGLARDAADELRKSFSENIKNWIRSKMTDAPPLKLTETQMNQIFDDIRIQADRLNISQEKAEELISFTRYKIAGGGV